MRPVTVFSDAGIDDLVAIRHLMSVTRVSAVVATGGNFPAGRAFDILTHFFGGHTRVFEGRGSGGALSAVHRGLGILSLSPVRDRPNLKGNEKRVVETGSVVLSLAPLTDLAPLLRECHSAIDELIVMGGAHRVSGNETVSGEFNFSVDPFAAMQTLIVPVRKTIVPLDVSARLRFHEEHIRAIPDEELRSLLQTVLAHYEDLGDRSFPLHDATAALFVTHPQGFTLKPRFCSVSTAGETSGQLLVDERRYGRREPNSLLAVDIDKPFLRSALLGRRP